MTISMAVPTPEPVTSAEVEESLVLASGWDAATLTRLISAAREIVELETDRSMINRDITIELDDWPEDETIYLPRGPVSSVTSVKYIDTAGTQQTLVEGTDYRVTIRGDVARITPVNSWPSVDTERKGVIEVIYVAGYGATGTDVPEDMRSAVIAKVDHLYSKGHISEYYRSIIIMRKNHFDYGIND